MSEIIGNIAKEGTAQHCVCVMREWRSEQQDRVTNDGGKNSSSNRRENKTTRVHGEFVVLPVHQEMECDGEG